MAIVGFAAYAGVLQALDTPTEWGKGGAGYGKRFASTAAWSGIHSTLAFGLDTALHQDPRYYRSGAGGWRRVGHAAARDDTHPYRFGRRDALDVAAGQRVWRGIPVQPVVSGPSQHGSPGRAPGQHDAGVRLRGEPGRRILAGHQAKGVPQEMIRARSFLLSLAALGVCLFLAPQSASAYSVLTHEAIIDSTWDSGIRPLLVKRFPTCTADELREAHGFAYGGSIIQDLGYYPFGSAFYSDLTHYVRSGDFIANMIRDSQDLDEYAFALGALAHFAADNNGHRIATNVSVALLYPKLRLKFGNSVTYADDHVSHSKTEFAFDVFQASKGRYASEGYKDFVGFQVSKRVLQQAFLDTYGMESGARVPERGSGDRVVPPRRGNILPAHQSRLANQRAGDPQGGSGHHPQEVPLQPLPLELRKELGLDVPAAGLPVASAGHALPYRAPHGPYSRHWHSSR